MILLTKMWESMKVYFKNCLFGPVFLWIRLLLLWNKPPEISLDTELLLWLLSLE